jgi:hypothetical protein
LRGIWHDILKRYAKKIRSDSTPRRRRKLSILPEWGSLAIVNESSQVRKGREELWSLVFQDDVSEKVKHPWAREIFIHSSGPFWIGYLAIARVTATLEAAVMTCESYEKAPRASSRSLTMLRCNSEDVVS